MLCAVAHEVRGPSTGAPVVLAGSLGTSMASWDRQVPALAERHLVVRYDHRGHGESPVPPGPYSIADLGEDAVALLDHLDIAAASFVGTSLGGMVGMWLAAHVPERVDRLVVICSSARLGPPSTWTERAATVRREGTAAVADLLVARWFTPAFVAREPNTVECILAQLRATSSEGYAGCCEAIGAMDLLDSLHAISAPTLVVAGACDPATTVADARAIADRVPEARLVTVPDAAHLAVVEQPDVVNELLRGHLA